MSVSKLRFMRRICAFAIVAILVGGIAAAGVLQPENSDQNVEMPDFHETETMAVEGADALLDRMQANLARWQGEFPHGFESEIVVLPGMFETYAYEERGVFGYCVWGDAESSMRRIGEAMSARGWTEVPLNGVIGATYVKSAGRYTWALITCTQIAEVSSVVIRCMECGS